MTEPAEPIKDDPLWEVRYEQAIVWYDVIRARTGADAATELGDRIRDGELHHFAGDQNVQARSFNGEHTLGPAPEEP